MDDMVVSLYSLDYKAHIQKLDALENEGIEIVRALAPDREEVLDFVKQLSGKYAYGEAALALSRQPISIFIALRGAEILGYSIYDATAKGLFGPVAVLQTERGRGLGDALTMAALFAMKEEGYAYAVIGSPGPVDFYKKICGAQPIVGSEPGCYSRFLLHRRENKPKK